MSTDIRVRMHRKKRSNFNIIERHYVHDEEIKE